MFSTMATKRKKLIVVLGQTSSGKSALAVKLAKKFNGEVISADSRQVYKGMDIGTGKLTKKEMKGIPHHLLDVASPKKRFTVAQYQKLALKAIDEIYKKGKVPILCGGTGFYIRSVVDGIVIPKVKPNWKLRKKLQKKSNEKLFELLKRLDPERANNIDKHNPRRLIRALEIVLKTKKAIPPLIKKNTNLDILMLGIKKSPKKLKKLINKRLLKRLKEGMIAEVKKLRKSGLSWKKLEDFGLEYRWISKFLQKKISYEEMVEKLQKDTEHFAKRQMTWFKKDKRIRWINNTTRAEILIKNFLKEREKK
jgi:tRNA dimethylallyltransferase